jgi:membrane protein DedA with SNARE-associated domain
MTDVLLGLVSTYGTVVIAVSTFLSCLALPIPASFIMLAGGAFVASGDLAAVAVVAAAFGGAVAGDQTGYRIGRIGGGRIAASLGRRPSRAAALARAERFVMRWGVAGVFFSRWLVSPLGPWVNLIAGATGMPLLRFSVPGAAGEAIWVAIYVGLGYAFAANIDALSAVMGNAVAATSALAVAGGLGLALLRAARRR